MGIADRKTFSQFVFFTLLFILFTIIGTLSHEMGHIFVAKLLGYTTELHFGFMNTIEEYSSDLHAFLISSRGPIQTMATGTVGYLLLKSSVKNKAAFSNKDYVWFFLSLFWLRQVFNLINHFLLSILSEEESFFGGDEFHLSIHLNLPSGFFSVLFGSIGIVICVHVFFFLVKRKNRVLLIGSGITGSLLGFWLWMYELGPTLLP